MNLLPGAVLGFALVLLSPAAFAQDTQVGPDVRDPGPADAGQGDPGPADAGLAPKKPVAPEGLPGMGPIKRAKPKKAPGIYPVYEWPEGWVMLDRDGKPKSIKAGSQFLVVGAKAASLFSVTGTTMSWAGCTVKRPTRVPGYFLGGRGMEAVGTPIIAIRVPPGKRLDPRQARFYRLVNEVSDSTYNMLGEPLKKAILEDVQSGSFLFKLDDSLGAHYQKNPSLEKIQLKIDFGSKIRIGGVKNAFALVEGANISKTYRRCVRVFADQEPLGPCAEMPHDLMAETQVLDFVAYDPSGKGRPFVLAYTTREPLWGHERWGFQVSKAGAKRFLMDAIDHKCRERF